MDAKINIIRSLEVFLKKQHDRKSPLLLALSGGSDSMALFYSLCKVKKDFLHVVHIDHGWREESRDEALEIERLVKDQNIPFYSMRIASLPKNNIEDFCRKKRLEFYQSLCEKYSFQAVLLGHHQDDLLETVLKRVFEGSSLQKLYGMEEVSQYENLQLWRPFLNISKKDLLSFLEKGGYKWYEDYTNQDSKYLRARMRSEMIPFLQKSFGKDFSKNLVYLSKRSAELNKSLDNRLKSILLKKEKGPLGSYLDLQLINNFDPFEKEHFFSLLLQSEGIDARRSIIESLLSWSKDSKHTKTLEIQETTIIIDRQKIFFLKQSPLTFPSVIELSVGDNQDKFESVGSTWKSLWKGTSSFYIDGICPEKEGYELALALEGEDQALFKWWSAKKVPVFLRRLFPVVKKEGKIIADLLSGYRATKKEKPFLLRVEIQPEKGYNNLRLEICKN